jgi:hypothetical protein
MFKRIELIDYGAHICKYRVYDTRFTKLVNVRATIVRNYSMYVITSMCIMTCYPSAKLNVPRQIINYLSRTFPNKSKIFNIALSLDCLLSVQEAGYSKYRECVLREATRISQGYSKDRKYVRDPARLEYLNRNE